MKRIRNNDLTHYFFRDHSELPESYLKSCREFFKWLDESNKEGFKAPSSKPQATSGKPQATSDKLPHIQTIE